MLRLLRTTLLFLGTTFWLLPNLGVPLTRSVAHAVEGMFPMSELARLDLKSAGLEIDPLEIYNPDGLSLIDGICKVGGCTGSFVSDQGLILTNHHCAFRAIQAASSEERDYLTHGFLASSLQEEVWAKGYTVRITESYRDVSDRVLAAVADDMDPFARTKAIEKRKKELELEAEKEYPGKRAEVAEMFLGKTYVLFLYTWLRDVRLVHAPPRAIGEFGGEEDNWIWPRHSGDYSFMRAYVAPDGTPADYSPDNVPYRPRKFLQVARQGANEGDFVFLFGYPGRTYRHRTWHFLDYEANVRMPWIVDWYGWQIELMEERSADDPTAQLHLASRLGRVWNTYKNYSGKLRGIQRLDLVGQRRELEEELQRFIANDASRHEEYGGLLAEIGDVYRRKREDAAFDLWLNAFTRSPYILSFAVKAYDAAHERQKPDVEREAAYQERNWPQTVRRLQLQSEAFDATTDRAILSELLRRGGEIAAAREIPALVALLGPEGAEAATRFLDEAFTQSHIHQMDVLTRIVESTSEELEELGDPFVDLAIALYPFFLELRDAGKTQKGELDRLHASLLEIKKEFLGTDFVPDANGTLRLTYGGVRGYRPRDAVYYAPQTTLGGVIQKGTGSAPFIVPERLQQLYRQKDFGPYVNEELGDVPACLLYSADTSGGNSGSPIFDARGRLVGVNFDRAWEATINDFDWDDSYSRSIGVDIRYVLFLTSKYAQADRLLEEMGVAE
jgi:hypothetical protein